MQRKVLPTAIAGVLLASLAACGGGGSSATLTNPNPTPQAVLLPLSISDAASEDWATVGVKILSVALVPQGGGSNVTVYTAPTPVPVTNLVQLDNLSDVIGTPQVAAGTYTGAVITISANPGDVTLITSSDPESGFAAAASTAIASDAIHIQDATGGSGSLTVPIKVSFESALTLTSGQAVPLDLEFDLRHPAFIVGHRPAVAAGATLWSVDFDGPVRHHRVADIAALVLRHLYGTISGVAADSSAFTITKDHPTYPAVTPETAVAGNESLTILADASNGTLVYDVDGKSVSTVKDFTSVAALIKSGEFVRIAARYQENGTLVAVRVWASSSFNSVWVSPEGHVRHVDTALDVISVDDENGQPVRLSVDANTKFYFRTPANALSDATPIGTGPAFLASHNLVRGFKIHASVDPLLRPMVAQTIDIETAAYSGTISSPDAMQFTYTRRFYTAVDDYQITLPYLSSTTPNGKDASGNVVDGFKWWNFAFPTLADTGSQAITDFINATGSAAVSFGGAFGSVDAVGLSYATWADVANPSGWAARFAVLEPVPLPVATVTSGYANGSFDMALSNNAGGNSATVNVSSSAGAATLAYQIDRSNGVVTVSPVDITTANGLAAITAGLVAGAPVKVWGVPEATGTLKAYVIAYYTGDMPGG